MDYFKTDYPMRADQISLEIFKDVKYTKDLIKVNPVLKDTLIIPKNTIILIPEVQKDTSNKEVNLWS